ncbi:protein kinase [Rhodoferax sp. AJA081-3]|uniref:serine/threonine-protein kinase n=1 Tax=Rhodoferax sp. AJA081-3 TaxID=2752316 RepID=UPI001ADF1651|nr:serine/threonine-protein kinase [Rhodoferax sp. AJA081-3]QTN28106.1 protein kinase [Rhodoferax sp. AJA081-3]
MADIEKLGRYDIVRVLGKGAMGVVYEGRDPNLDRQVAIKTIRVQSLSAEAASEYEVRFRTEARSAARLHHPNIVSVFDSGQDGDTAYLVMEFIQGEDLKHHLENGARFSVRSSIVMVHDLLMALDHAHRQNVVHRDVKPANMLIELSGRVKLTDFGVARIQEPDETHLTQVGGAVGTPKYMSPEQAKGLRGDSRSDVFSAGVVLYELLTGILPFDGENQFVVIHQIVGHEPTKPSMLNPDVPAAMDEVMARAMAKNPDERYATAREFGLALRVVAQHMGASSGDQNADVAAELGKIIANRVPVAPPAALRDGSSTGIFGPGPDVSMVTTVNHEEELGNWNKIKDSTVSQNFLDYLARYPAGIYARRAQQRLDQLALDNTSSRAKTLPQFRPQADEPDLDSTMGPFAATQPAPAPARAEAAAVAAVVKQGSKGPLWAIAAAICVLVVLMVVLWPKLQTGGETLVTEAPPVVAAAPGALPSPPIIEEKESDSVPVQLPNTQAAAASRPSVGASVPAAKPSRPATAALASASGPAKANAAAPSTPPAVQAPVAAAPVAPREPAPTPAVQGNNIGPSAAGQVCSDKVFIFRIACIAEQCKTDRFRQTGECIRFREMEKKREEGAAIQQR